MGSVDQGRHYLLIGNTMNIKNNLILCCVLSLFCTLTTHTKNYTAPFIANMTREALITLIRNNQSRNITTEVVGSDQMSLEQRERVRQLTALLQGGIGAGAGRGGGAAAGMGGTGT